MLINCAADQDGRKLADIAKGQIGAYVQRSECFVWVALKDPDPQELEEMQRNFGLHPLAVEDARHGHQRPKIEKYADSLFAVVHTAELGAEEVVSGVRPLASCCSLHHSERLSRGRRRRL
jgi:magnesium transporter